MNPLPFISIVLCTAGASLCFKVIADRMPKFMALLFMYLFSAVFVFVFWLMFDRTAITVRDFIVVGLVLAFLNYLSVQCQWSAYKINMSRASLMMPLKSILAVSLLAVFLGEHNYFAGLAATGFFFHLVAIWLFGLGSQSKESERISNYKKWLFFTIAMVSLTALIQFLMKILSSSVPTTSFLLIWYASIFVYFSLSFHLWKDKKRETSEKGFFVFVPLTSFFTVANLASLYWAFQVSPGIAVVSFSALSETFVPAVIGWVVFKEARNISRIELIGLGLGIIAALMIILSR